LGIPPEKKGAGGVLVYISTYGQFSGRSKVFLTVHAFYCLGFDNLRTIWAFFFKIRGQYQLKRHIHLMFETFIPEGVISKGIHTGEVI
jgi:hypothetical protein